MQPRSLQVELRLEGAGLGITCRARDSLPKESTLWNFFDLQAARIMDRMRALNQLIKLDKKSMKGLTKP
jgi:hypothetical protein